MMNNYTILNFRSKSGFGSWQSNEGNSSLSLFGLRKMCLLVLFFVLNLISVQDTLAQVSFSQNFNVNSTGWTGTITRTTATTACGSASMRRNMYSSLPTGNMVSPQVGTTLGGQITLSYDYKVANWLANTVGTSGWGSFNVQYSSSATGPWTTVQTINTANHIVSGSCATRTVSFTPPSGALFIKWDAFWTAGDYYINFDNVVITEAAASVCSGTPNNGSIVISSTSGCSGGALNFSSSGLSVGSGISYQWQSSTTNSDPWTNLATGGSYSTTSVAGTTYYRLASICSNSASTSYSNVVSFAGISCGSVNVPTSGNSLVDCGTSTFIYDNGGPSADYVNSSNGFTVLDNSGTGVITLSGNVLGMESCCDDIFIYSGAGTGGTLLANYTTAGAITTIVSAPGQPITIAFSSDGSVVGAGFAFQAIYSGTCLTCDTPVAGTASAATAAYCNSGSTTISATGYSQGTGTRYQWESSTDNFATAGVAIGSVSNNYSSLSTGTLTTTTSYRLRVFCDANPGGAVYSSVATVTINFSGTISVAGAATICSGQSTPLTAAQLTGASPMASYAWSPTTDLTPATGANVSASPASTTTYTVTGQDGNGCFTPGVQVTVTVNQSPSTVTVTPTVDAGSIFYNTSTADYNICAENIVKLTTSGGTVAGSGIANISFGTNLQSFGPATTFSANITGIPSGATITSAALQFTNVNALGGSYRSEIRAELTGAHSLGATSISALSSAGLISPDPSIPLPGFTAATGAIDLVLSESFDDGGATVVDATFGEVKLVINYTFPTSVPQNWTSTPASTLYTDAAATVGNEYVPGTPATIVYARPTGTTTYYSNTANGSCPTVGNATINVNALPTFTVAPITICSGSTGTLTAVTAENNSYSWTGGLSGQSVMVSPTEDTTYQVIATSNSGTPACSSDPVSVLVTVNDQGSIINQPANQITSVGNGATFTVDGTVGVPYTYEWQRRISTTPSAPDFDPTGTWSSSIVDLPASNFSGATTNTLTVSNATALLNNTVYRCILTPLLPCTPLVSSAATLSVLNIGIASNPQNVSICLPTSVAQFNVVTNGTGTITRAIWEVSSNNFATFTTIPLYTTGGNVISSGYNGPNTTAVPGLTFEFPLVASVRDYKTLTISGINSTSFNGLRFRVRFNNTIVSQSGLLTVSEPAAISIDLSTTPVVRCQVPASASPTVLSISTTGTVSAVVWKYATTAGAADASYSPVTNSTPAGATYVSSNPSTGVYQLSVATTAATPLGNYYYKAFLTGVSPCSDINSAEATISIVRPTVTAVSSAASYCTPGSAIMLTAGGASSYAWSPTIGLTPADGLGASVSATPSASTTYTVTGTDGNGCTNTAQVTVGVGSSFTVAASAAPTTVCPNGVVQLASAISIPSALLIDPTANGGFETGATFPLNGWTVVNPATNTWQLGSVAGAASGVRGAFISNDSGASNSYTITTSQTAHFYRDVVIPAGSTNIALSFQWKGRGESGWDRLLVYRAPTSLTPTTASPVSSSTTLSGATLVWTQPNSTQSTYATANITLPNSLAGTTVRLIFTWQNDTSIGTSPAAAVDNISLTATPAGTYTYAWTSTPASFTASTANTTANPGVNTTYNLNVTASSGCRAQSSVAVAVDSVAPVLAPLASTLNSCVGSTVSFTVSATSPTPLTYQWLKNGSPLTNGAGISGATTSTLTISGITLATAGNYSVNVTNCSTVTSTTTVLNVNPLPTATIAGSTAVCLNSASPTVTFTGANGTAPYTFTYKLNNGVNQTIVSTGNTATISVSTATAAISAYSLVSVQDSSSATCTNPQTGSATVTVNPLPVAPVLTSNSPICEGSSLNLNAAVAVQQGYTLNSNSGVAFIDISASGTSAGTISDDSEHPLTIPAFIYNGTTYTTALVGNNGALTFGITSGNIGFTNTALPGSTGNLGGTAATICALWDDLFPGAGGSIRTQTVANKYIVQWTQEDNFGATGTGTVTFQIQLDLTTSQIHLVYPDVIYGVIGFDNAQTATIGLNYSATSALQYSFNTASIINGQSLTFTPAAYSYAWSGPNGFSSAVQNPSIANATPAATGTYTLEITNGNGCKSSSTVNATVDRLPTASTSGSGTKAICSNSTYTLTASEATANYGTIAWTLVSGEGFISNGSTSEEPTYTAAPGDEGNNVTLLMTVTSNNSCGTATATASYTFHVDPLPTASTSGSGTKTICSNSSYTLTASEATANNGTILWTVQSGAGSITGGSTTEEPTYSAVAGDEGNDVTLLMTVTSNNTCGTATASASYTFHVDPLPTASTSGSGTKSICSYSSYTLTAAESTANNGTIQWTVQSGAGSITAGSTTEEPTYSAVAADAGNNVTLLMTVTSNNACGTATATATYTLYVYPIPTVTTTLNNVSYYSGFATAAIPLTGTPTGVTFTITGGAAAGLADVSGVSAIPSFIPTTITTATTVTVTPVANGCTGIPKTYQIIPIPVIANMTSSQCGSINTGLNNQLQAGNVSVPGYTTTGYRFEVTNTATGEVAYVDTVHSMFKLTDTSIYAYGTTFAIRVAVYLNGNLQGYFGNTCLVTTASVQTTKVVTAQCGATLTALNSTINANSVGSTNLYRFRVARADAPTTYYLLERTVPNFNLSMVVGLPLTYETEYKVDVQIRVSLAGFVAWSQYGAVCSVFTPVVPTTSLTLADCELVATSYSQTINIIPYPGATSYRVMLIGYDIDSNVNYTQTLDTVSPTFTLSQFTGLNPETAYTVAISINLFGSYTPYGKDCSVTTPAGTGRTGIVNVKGFKAVAYPNPFANNFMIDVKSSSESAVNLKVYDMIGRLVEQRDVRVSDLVTSTIGERYPSGVYNVVVSQDESVQTVRVVKR